MIRFVIPSGWAIKNLPTTPTSLERCPRTSIPNVKARIIYRNKFYNGF